MDWNDLGAALALYLVLEGLLPFASPSAWRRGLAALGDLADGQLRLMGLAAVLGGLVLLWIVRSAG